MQKNKNREKGFTLAELVISMTVLSVLLLGTTTLNNSMLRIGTAGLQTGEFQGALNFAFRTIDKDINSASEVRILELPKVNENPMGQMYRWSIYPEGGNANDVIDYELDLEKETFKRKVRNDTLLLVPSGHVIVGPGKFSVTAGGVTNNYALAAWFSDGNKMLTVNIGLKTTDAFGKEIVNPGYTKSFYIQTGQTKDCQEVNPCV